MNADVRVADELARAQALGFLGTGSIDSHIAHARAMAAAAQEHLGRLPETVLDLGSGGGVPGLVLADVWTTARVVLVESMIRRASHLRDAVARLGWAGRVEVDEERAEVTAHRPDRRERFTVVTARSFAVAAATAEIGAAFVELGGVLVVSEPPTSPPERWPTEGVGSLGLVPPTRVERNGAHFAVFAKTVSSPPGVPRATGRPAKRPRW